MWFLLTVGSALVVSALGLRDAQLPFCNPDSTTNNDLVIVSTLDGQLTAFSAEGGVKAWDIQTEPLLSSNLQHVEFTSGGKWGRLVPSLSGALYRLSGDSLEALPLSAEQFLSSSYKYSEDLVVAGSREMMWTGLDPLSGRVVYHCGSQGCVNDEESAGNVVPDLIVLKHSAHTVRALDPRTGQEKWNFSVAEHHLSGGEGSACARVGADLSVSLVLPEGVVGVSREEHVLWKHKLSSPVADVWTLTAGRLQRVDVLQAASNAPAAEPPVSLYIGVHNQQMYVQEGASYNRQTATALAARTYRPRPIRAQLPSPQTNTALQQVADPEHVALATLYGGVVAQNLGNHGYFLSAELTTCDQGTSVTEDELAADSIRPDPDYKETHHHVHVHVSSLWFWWKEVLLIAISSALLMNLMIWPRFFAPKFRPPTPLPINKEYVIVERHYDVPENCSPQPSPPADYNSRYASDFTPLRCLGRGGFGVVFECRNNIDHCSYAVKRITLPRRESKRERVLREVRALAKLEHENIVRYFNAWLEEPPPAWQEERDAVWIRDLEGVTVSMTEDHNEKPIDTNHVSRSIDHNLPVVLNLQKQTWEHSLDAQFDKSEHPSKRIRSLSCNDSFSVVFSENGAEKTNDSIPNRVPSKHMTEDDSYIVFAHSADLNHNSGGAGDAPSVNKHLEKVKDCDPGGSKAVIGGKKKGHRRHWSLDLCVRSTNDTPVAGSKMYLYIQMQLCRRDSLHDWLRQNRSYKSRKDQVRSLFSQIVSAVEYVHLAGLIHRDLKPSNIFFSMDGRIKVGDFGLVTAMSDSSQDGAVGEFDPQTRHTHRVGTHLYMSPEQLRGDPYDYKVDIYSLGLILFELLEPFSTESERVSCLLRLRQAGAPQQFREKLPHETELLDLMLSGSPSQRPTAAGVRSRAPLCQQSDPQWHFTLPPPVPQKAS